MSTYMENAGISVCITSENVYNNIYNMQDKLDKESGCHLVARMYGRHFTLWCRRWQILSEDIPFSLQTIKINLNSPPPTCNIYMWIGLSKI